MTPGIVTRIRSRPRSTILACSLLWALCYPPFPLGPLAFAVLAPAFVVTEKLTRRGAFGAWFLGGLLYNTAMYWWIWQVMKVGPAVVVGLGLVTLIGFLSLFNGLIGYAFRAALDTRRRVAMLALFPLAFAGLEAARAAGEMSFPWNNLGYTLGAWPLLFQSVSEWGVYGLSAMMVAANLLLFVFLREGVNGRGRVALAGFAAIPFAMWMHGSSTLTRANDAAAPRIDIALVQPSIPQTRKWDEAYFAEVMTKTFRTLSGKTGDLSPVRGADLIVLAETAVPDFLRRRPGLVDSLRGAAVVARAPVLAGALDYVRDRHAWSEYAFYNSAFLFSADPGDSLERPAQYSKLRLVPFSEAIPFKGILPVLNYVEGKVGSGGFSPGDGYRVWTTRGIAWAPSICYEVIYPAFVREARAAGAKLLVNVTNDGWFGRSNGPYQHANIARFRAAENGMPVARCANNGVSVFYDAWGRDLGRTALMDSTVLRRQVPVPDRATAYSRFGGVLDGFFLASAGLWAAALVAWRPRRARSTLFP